MNLNTMQSVLFSFTDPPPASANDSARRVALPPALMLREKVNRRYAATNGRPGQFDSAALQLPRKTLATTQQTSDSTASLSTRIIQLMLIPEDVTPNRYLCGRNFNYQDQNDTGIVIIFALRSGWQLLHTGVIIGLPPG